MLEKYNQQLKNELDKLEKLGLYRELTVLDSAADSVVTINGKEYLNFCSNNYLGLATHPEVKYAAIEATKKWGTGSGASRLICGSNRLSQQLEEKIAHFKSTETAIVFSTGYMANVGVITSLAGKADIIIIDKLNHASIIDGCKLSGAAIRVYKHCDCESLEKVIKNSHQYRRRLIITDAVFSMEGDVAPLKEIVSLARKYDALVMVDEAHSTGVFGKSGAGCAEHFGIADDIDIQMGTLSKAIGCVGGYIAGSNELIALLRNKARPFIYSTALPPSVYASAIKAFEIIEKEPGRRRQLWENIQFFKTKLTMLGLNTENSQSQIIPIIIGNEKKTIQIAEQLKAEGILIMGIRPPTIKKGSSRLRISLMATHTIPQIEQCIEKMGIVFR